MVVGDLMLDKYVWGEVSRISPEAPIPVINVAREELRPGGAGAVITNLVHLGARVLCTGVVGQDAVGQNLVQMIEKLGVDTSGMFTDTERPTTVKTRMMGHLHTAGRGVQQLLRVDYERTHPVSKEIEDKVIDYVKTNLHSCDAVALSDMNKGLLTEKLLKTVSSLGRAAGKPVVVDPGMGSNCAFYKGVAVVTPNRRETEIMTGLDMSSPENLKSAGSKLVESLDLQCATITLDKDGIFLYQRDGTHLILPTNPREVYDVTGAGDMILSMITFVIAGGFN
ncbi:MAG: bifunctional heptose 7-phosphate kinase/heptose 1-phosphate adenyltransferase, partial [Candidatus Brocadiales bacterium]